MSNYSSNSVSSMFSIIFKQKELKFDFGKKMLNN